MDEQQIVLLLNQLSEFQSQMDLLRLDKQRLLDEAVPAEVKKRLDEINDEFSGKITAAQENILETQALIKDGVIEHGKSVKGAHIHAVYSKPRASWDTGKLEGLAVAYPEILSLRSFGQPSVSFRSLGE